MHIAYLGETTSLVPFSPMQLLHGSPVTYFHDVCGGGAGSSRQESSGSSQHTHTFPKVLLKVLLNPLMGGSDPEFRKISEDLLISAAVPGFSYELVCEKTCLLLNI